MVTTLWSGPVSVMLTTVTVTLKPPAAAELWQDTSQATVVLDLQMEREAPKGSPPIEEVHT